MDNSYQFVTLMFPINYPLYGNNGNNLRTIIMTEENCTKLTQNATWVILFLKKKKETYYTVKLNLQK